MNAIAAITTSALALAGAKGLGPIGGAGAVVSRPGETKPEASEQRSFAGVPSDTVELSEEARSLFAAAAQTESAPDAKANAKEASDPTSGELTEEEESEVKELEDRDREVRAHEQAHLSALGGEGGAVSYTFETGPDGKRYAVGGEVPISISEVEGDPAATVEKAGRIVRAALAPQQPSGADFAAAQKARALQAEAQKELQAERQDQAQGLGGTEDSAGSQPAGENAAAQDAFAANAPKDLVETALAASAGLRPYNDHDHVDGGGCAHCQSQQAA